MRQGPLRYGFTTGTCAAVAAKAAAVLLLTGNVPEYEEVITPSGRKARMRILEIRRNSDIAACAVKKDAGDDPDVTDQALVTATVSYIEGLPDHSYESEQKKGIWLTAGEGVGIVTLPGLSCPVGMPAINPVPRKMILKEVEQVFERFEGILPVLVKIGIPGGEELAKKTFNPKLGIEGGISILGTSGIVEPMSEQALLDTIRLEIRVRSALGDKSLLLVPGNYGMDFLRDKLGLDSEKAVKCSNFVSDAVCMAVEEGMERILLAGHIGKLIKVAGGIPNTHSKYGDGRMEFLGRYTKEWLEEHGMEDQELILRIQSSNTTEEALGFLHHAGIMKPVMDEVAVGAGTWLRRWSRDLLETEVVTFSTVYDILGMTKGAKTWIRRWEQTGEDR